MNMFFDKAIADGISDREALRNLVDQINDNPNLLETLSSEKLDQVEAYYDEEIKRLKNQNDELRERICKLKITLNSGGVIS